MPTDIGQGFATNTIGGDTNIWGTTVNANATNTKNKYLTRADDLNFADYKLKRPVLQDYGEELQTVAVSSGTVTIDLESGNHVQVSLTENVTTWSISNATASGDACILVLYLTQDGTGGRTVTFPASFRFALGTPTVTATANRTDIYVCITRNGGTTWAVSVNGQGYDLT